MSMTTVPSDKLKEMRDERDQLRKDLAISQFEVERLTGIDERRMSATIKKQAAEIDGLKQALSEIGVTPEEAKAGAARSKAKCTEIKELRAALVEATGALDKVSATRNIGSAHIVAREALARCKGALK